ncbi:hypothetical protein SAMN06265379_103405 [Saccharicrinis carchari]|uniref:Tetratricopeptide repeat-containing protein n=1 Tax=Saccharicrinis carchari TaxID=1168039 RepID=A0A521CTM7_SACCC|nr:hypothetical protein [Saccharicrinis carchari]SMO62081.1 hypothetical protein SAMN06265379_103405 [Saccharicrinis carchari]
MVRALHLKLLLASCLLCAVSHYVYAQKVNTAYQQNLYAVLNGDSVPNDTLAIACGPATRAYLKNYRLFLNAMIQGDSSTEYRNAFKSISDTLNKYAEEEEGGWAFLSEIYLQKGLVEYNANKQRDALFSFFKAHRYWQKSEREQPDLVCNLKLRGVFNLLMSNMPQPYKRMAGWIGFSGNSQAGFKALNTYLKASSYKIGSEQDALIYTAFSYLKFDINDTQTENLIRNWQDKNLVPLAQFVLTRCAFKIRKPQLAHTWFTDSISEVFLPMLYLQGKYQTLRFDDRAENTLLDYIRKNTSGHFVADAHRYLSWYYFLKNDTANYNQQLKLISKLSVYPTWEDKQARYESKLSESYHKVLLQSRMLFDAGEYKSAIDTLSTHQESISGAAQNVEFQYRLGRCYQMIKDHKRAIFHYSEAIKTGGNDKRYFAPYAAMLAAELFLDKNPITAKFYLNEAKRLNNGEHKAEIERRIELLQGQLK